LVYVKAVERRWPGDTEESHRNPH